MTADGSTLSAVVDSRTARPTRTIPQVSTDLQTWDLSGVSVAYSQSNPRLSKIITPQNALAKFVRAEIVPRVAAVTPDEI